MAADILHQLWSFGINVGHEFHRIKSGDRPYIAGGGENRIGPFGLSDAAPASGRVSASHPLHQIRVGEPAKCRVYILYALGILPGGEESASSLQCIAVAKTHLHFLIRSSNPSGSASPSLWAG